MGQHIRIRWDSDCENCSEGALEFRLTYAGELKAHKDNRRLRDRPYHVHAIRQEFHKQLRELWRVQPALVKLDEGSHYTSVDLEGFTWRPMVTNHNELLCKLDIVMLRTGDPGRVIADIDNRLKTLFDALKMPDGPEELGSKSGKGQITPADGEDPFFVLVQDDRLISHVSVTSDVLLEPVPDVSPQDAARLMISVTVFPYGGGIDSLSYV